jgi:hypothetical protein
VKLTKRLIEATPPREKRFFIWDGEFTGFGCCIHPGGRRSYVVRYRTEDGRDRRMVLGTHGALTPQLARQRAAEILGRVAGGADPATERQDARHALTMAELAERYLAEHAIKKKSGDEDRRKLEADILPVIGRLKVAKVTVADISTLHARMKGRPVAANRVLALLRKMFNLAERWGLHQERIRGGGETDATPYREAFVTPGSFDSKAPVGLFGLGQPSGEKQGNDGNGKAQHGEPLCSDRGGSTASEDRRSMGSMYRTGSLELKCPGSRFGGDQTASLGGHTRVRSRARGACAGAAVGDRRSGGSTRRGPASSAPPPNPGISSGLDDRPFRMP